MSRILMTGASKGIGYAATLLLARAGHEVIATTRNPSASDLEKVAQAHGRRIHAFFTNPGKGEATQADPILVAQRRTPAERVFTDTGVDLPSARSGPRAP